MNGAFFRYSGAYLSLSGRVPTTQVLPFIPLLLIYHVIMTLVPLWDFKPGTFLFPGRRVNQLSYQAFTYERGLFISCRRFQQ